MERDDVQQVTAKQRFWAKVDREGPIPEHRPDLGPCWVWTAARMPTGYGRFKLRSYVTALPHRVAYEWLVGPIPEGLSIDHLCRNRACVNPAHLEPVTSRENVMRGVGFTAVNGAKTHCPHGHEYTPENTYRRSDGSRRCRTCVLGKVSPRRRFRVLSL